MLSFYPLPHFISMGSPPHPGGRGAPESPTTCACGTGPTVSQGGALCPGTPKTLKAAECEVADVRTGSGTGWVTRVRHRLRVSKGVCSSPVPGRSPAALPGIASPSTRLHSLSGHAA